MIATHQPKSDTKISDEKIILSNGDEILLKDGEFFSFKRAPYYTTIDDVTYKVITTYYDENKMIIGYLNEETQIMTIEWYEYNQLVNTHNFDLQGLPQGE